MSETETALRTLCAAQLSGRRKPSGGNPNNTMMVVLPGSTSDENMMCVPSSRRQCESTTPPSKSSAAAAAAVEAPADPVSSTEVEYVTSEDLKDMNDIDVHLQVSILNPHSSYSLSSKVRVVVVAVVVVVVVVVVGFMPCHTSKLLVICGIGIQSLQHESVCMQLASPIAEAIMVVFLG